MPKRREEDVEQTDAIEAPPAPDTICPLLTDQQIMDILNIKRTTLYRLMHHPVYPMPYIKFFSLLRFDAKDIGNWLQDWKSFSNLDTEQKEED